MKKSKSVAIISLYFKTLAKARDAYKKLSPELRDRQSLVQLGNCYLILGNTQIKALAK